MQQHHRHHQSSTSRERERERERLSNNRWEDSLHFDSNMAAMAVGSSSPSPTPQQPSPLHNTSFTLTRLTPLCKFNADRFSNYAREFRNIIAGDTIRGVDISIQPTDRVKAALVKSCEWTIVTDLIPTEPFNSVVIKLTWDDGSIFIAILMPDYTSGEIQVLGKRKRGGRFDPDSEFNSLPLLLTRGPQLVTQQLVDYLTTRFDSRASDLRLPAELLGECLQGYLELVFEDRSTPTSDRRVRLLEVIFSVPESKESKVKSALRKITLSLTGNDVEQLYRRYLNHVQTHSDRQPCSSH